MKAKKIKFPKPIVNKIRVLKAYQETFDYKRISPESKLSLVRYIWTRE